MPYVNIKYIFFSFHFVIESQEKKMRSEEHTSELQSLRHLVCRLLLEKKKKKRNVNIHRLYTIKTFQSASQYAGIHSVKRNIRNTGTPLTDSVCHSNPQTLCTDQCARY